MGVSSIGQTDRVGTIRHAVATAFVVLGLFYYLYGPPITERMAAAAHDRCNELTGSTYRSYRLVWATTTYSSISRPHWLCYDLEEPGSRGIDLGWWVDL